MVSVIIMVQDLSVSPLRAAIRYKNRDSAFPAMRTAAACGKFHTAIFPNDTYCRTLQWAAGGLLWLTIVIPCPQKVRVRSTAMG